MEIAEKELIWTFFLLIVPFLRQGYFILKFLIESENFKIENKELFLIIYSHNLIILRFSIIT